ncbi:hypothetical protein [Polaribacter sp. M15]
MQIIKKNKYTLISSDENSFTDFYASFLNTLPQLEKEHIIIEISNKINIKKEDFLLFLATAEQKKDSGTSFVIINAMVNVDDLPENLNIVPTLIEAEDILEMETMERELGF